jgi:tetratricopeptide (TPR) repeat protein
MSVLAVIAISTYAFSQADDQTKARELGMKAIKEMDRGNIEKSIKLLEQAEELDPENVDYPYEIAYAHYLSQNYKEVIEILNRLVKNPKANDRVHQMLGNAYDMDGKPDKAIEVYDHGLSLFPNSGELHLERGAMELKKDQYDNALKYFEKGIKADPMFPSNYYWATSLYLDSTEKVWGMLYGEIFMNLERNSQRTPEISKMLYDTYKSQIEFSSGMSFSVNFSQKISISSISDVEKLKLPFEIAVYEPTIGLSIVGENNIDINSLHRIRTNFLNMYYKSGHNKDYPNVLFDYQKEVDEAGHLEAYNHWILMMGDEEAFSTWHEANEDKWDSFVAWFSENPIKLDNTHKFYRSQY